MCSEFSETLVALNRLSFGPVNMIATFAPVRLEATWYRCLFAPPSYQNFVWEVQMTFLRRQFYVIHAMNYLFTCALCYLMALHENRAKQHA